MQNGSNLARQKTILSYTTGSMLSLKMSRPPSFCQDVHCNLSANLLHSMDGMIYMKIFERNLSL